MDGSGVALTRAKKPARASSRGTACISPSAMLGARPARAERADARAAFRGISSGAQAAGAWAADEHAGGRAQIVHNMPQPAAQSGVDQRSLGSMLSFYGQIGWNVDG